MEIEIDEVSRSRNSDWKFLSAISSGGEDVSNKYLSNARDKNRKTFSESIFCEKEH